LIAFITGVISGSYPALFLSSFQPIKILRGTLQSDPKGSVFKYSSILAIFVACLGLFGLVSFMAEQRTKEIGIRKTLGASVTNIVLLFSKEFTKCVLIANIIALPAAYFFVFVWINDYTYRTTISFWIFILAAILTIVIALLTVSYQAVKAAKANPVDALRYE
jgi:putative ABC transport system permease protein